MAIAKDEKTPKAAGLAHWREARSWFQRSREILQVFNTEGKLTGDDLAKFESVIDGVAQCDAAIARLAK
ncbi:MAG: hypothetical protein DMF69_08360 [Acidobacteria bacterium]|nr:MAG: hypothetical protein DMF69_08360 [Acidobacteriota bacterium]